MFQELAGRLYEAVDNGHRVDPVKVEKILVYLNRHSPMEPQKLLVSLFLLYFVQFSLFYGSQASFRQRHHWNTL